MLDRMSGYIPDDPTEAFINDTYLPFKFTNVDTGAAVPPDGRGVYPLETPTTYLDWIEPYAKGVPGLINGSPKGRELVDVFSVDRSVFFFPGTCNPNATVDDDDLGYYYYLADCTAANNRIETGGVVSPGVDVQVITTKRDGRKDSRSSITSQTPLSACVFRSAVPDGEERAPRLFF